MEIVAKKLKIASFESVEPGECFVLGGEYYIKLFQCDTTEQSNAANIRTGTTRSFGANLNVYPVKMKAEVVSDD